MSTSLHSYRTAPCGRGSVRGCEGGPQRGFTLVELLISITLVAAISAGMLAALRMGLVTMDKITTRLDDNRRALGIERMLVQQIGGAMPMQASCATADGFSGAIGVFSGNSQTLRLVSSYSMDEGARGYPRLVEYQVLGEESGTVKLIVNEYPYMGPASAAPFCSPNGLRPAVATNKSFVVADRLAYCRILYRDFRDTDFRRLGGKWVAEWKGPEPPAGVRIEMEPAAPDGSRLPVMGVTVRLRLTRDPTNPYVDQ